MTRICLSLSDTMRLAEWIKLNFSTLNGKSRETIAKEAANELKLPVTKSHVRFLAHSVGLKFKRPKPVFPPRPPRAASRPLPEPPDEANPPTRIDNIELKLLRLEFALARLSRFVGVTVGKLGEEVPPHILSMYTYGGIDLAPTDKIN